MPIAVHQPIQDYSRVPDTAKRPVSFNGTLVDWESATLHLATHVTNYGSGVFEGIRFYETDKGPAVFHLDAHLDRLACSIGFFDIDSPCTIDEIKQACINVARASEAPSGYLRPQVQYGLSPRLALGALDVADVVVFFAPMGRYREKEGLSVITSEIQRISPKAVAVEAKVIGFYINSYFNHQHANANGADEAVMLDINGHVAEASSVNVFYVKAGELFTPEPGFILRGITRATVLELAAKELQIPAHETVVTVTDLRNADEIFFTGTAAEIEPVVEYDGLMIGDGTMGPVTAELRGTYTKATRGELPGYDHWLTALWSER